MSDIPHLDERTLKRFDRDGYLLIPDVFSAAEVARFRRFFESRLEKAEDFSDCDLLTYDNTAPFVSDGRLIGVAKQVLGAAPVYFGDSSAMSYSADAKVGTFHKDNADRHDRNAPDWRTPDYPLIRFGLYLQDHSTQGGGLMLRAGSHKTVAENRLTEVFREEVSGWFTGRTRYIRSRPGDLLVWNMRLTHAGMGRFLRLPFHRPVTERSQNFIPSFLQSTVKEQRLALFASFGTKGPALDRYLMSLKNREYMIGIWKNTAMTPELHELFERQGGELRDMKEEVLADEAAGRPVGQNKRWQPLPY